MRNPKRSKQQKEACSRIVESMNNQSIVMALKHEMFSYTGEKGVLALIDDLRLIKDQKYVEHLVIYSDPIFFGTVSKNPWKLLSDQFLSRKSIMGYKDEMKYVKKTFALLFACSWPVRGMPIKWNAIARDDATCRGILRTIQSKGAPWHNKTARKLIEENYSHQLLAFLDPWDAAVMYSRYPRAKWFVDYVEICSAYHLIPEDRLRHLLSLSRHIKNQQFS